MPKKTILITGAAGGIGACTAKILADDGYNVVINDIVPEEKASEVLAYCRDKGVEAMYIQGDVSSYASCEETIKKAADSFGGIYGLVNNAGITRDALLMRMTEEQFDKVIAVNLKSVFNMSKLAVSHMVKAREGRIVNISSIIGVHGNASQTNYSASKAGIIGFTKSLAKEVGSRGITVNAIAPGYVMTDMTAALPDSVKRELSDRIALKALGRPEDIANAVAFLMGERASYITAHVLAVDGGMSI